MAIKKDNKMVDSKKQPKIDEKWSQKNEITSRYLHIPIFNLHQNNKYNRC